jgi:hypothetical protein
MITYGEVVEAERRQGVCKCVISWIIPRCSIQFSYEQFEAWCTHPFDRYLRDSDGLAGRNS